MTTTPKQRKPWWLLGIAAAVAVLILAWAFFPSRFYEDYVPAEAKAVVRLEPSALQLLAQGSLLQSEWVGAAEAVDASRPVYAFITPNEYVGLTAAVADEAKLRSCVEGLVKAKKCLSIEESGGLSWAWLTAGWLLGWDGDALTVLGPGVAQERDALRQLAMRLRDADTPFTDTETYRTLLEQGGSAQLYAQLDALPTPYNLLFRLGLPADCAPEAVQLFAAVETKTAANAPARTEISCTMTSENGSIAATLASLGKGEKSVSLPAPSNGEIPLFRMVTVAKGKALLEAFRTNETLRDALLGLNQALDANRILGSTDGVLCLDVDSLARDWTPAFCLLGETHNADLLADADYWMASARKQKGVSLERTAPTTFRLRSGGQDLLFGTREKPLAYYFASPSMAANANRPFPPTTSGEANGAQLVCRINLQKLFSQPCLKDGELSGLLRMLLPGSRTLTYERTVGGKARLTIE